MKNKIFPVLLALTLVLSACSSAPSATENASPSESSTMVADFVNQSLTQSAPVATEEAAGVNSIELTADYENAASVELQLLLGTLKFEGTTLAVTTEQANALLPLWQSYSALAQSMMPMGQGQPEATPQTSTVDTEVQTQASELTKQIQSVMTVEQIQAIADMKLTQETAQTIIQELGLGMTDPQQGMGDGGQPQGTPPAGGTGGGQPPSGDQALGTPSADAGQRGGGRGIQPQLLEALIQLLEAKVNS